MRRVSQQMRRGSLFGKAAPKQATPRERETLCEGTLLLRSVAAKEEWKKRYFVLHPV